MKITTQADYDELVRLRDEGWEWLARNKADAIDYYNGWIAVSKKRPQWSMWGYDYGYPYKWVGKAETLPFVLPESSVNIASAIAEYERAQEGK